MEYKTFMTKLLNAQTRVVSTRTDDTEKKTIFCHPHAMSLLTDFDNNTQHNTFTVRREAARDISKRAY